MLVQRLGDYEGIGLGTSICSCFWGDMGSRILEHDIKDIVKDLPNGRHVFYPKVRDNVG